jgi:hypothetical protein
MRRYYEFPDLDGCEVNDVDTVLLVEVLVADAVLVEAFCGQMSLFLLRDG